MENHHLSVLTAASVRERHGRLLADNSNEKLNAMDHLTNSPLFATQSITQSLQITSLTRTLQCGLLAEMLLERDNALEESPPDDNLADKRLFFKYHNSFQHLHLWFARFGKESYVVLFAGKLSGRFRYDITAETSFCVAVSL
jgi:hypothetical protein